MMIKTFGKTFVFATLLLSACGEGDVRSSVFYTFKDLELTSPGQHYEHWVDENGGRARLGCFVVEERPQNCADVRIEGGVAEVIDRRTVVACECPCEAKAAHPCDATKPDVIAGVVTGIVDASDTVTLGGAQFDLDVVVRRPTSSYISLEDNSDLSPEPQTIIMKGVLWPDGEIYRGTLATSSAVSRGSGTVSLLINEDGTEF